MSIKINMIYEDLRKEYPEFISLEQLRKLAHISKRRASFYLKNDIIPCKDNGKKTKQYKIALSDVAEYLYQRNANPYKYRYGANRKPDLWEHFYYSISGNEYLVKEFLKFLNDCANQMPDMITLKDAVNFSGYSKSGISNWIRAGRICAFQINKRYHIQLKSFLNFLVSPYYLGLQRKTDKQLYLTNEFIKQCTMNRKGENDG